MAIDNQHEQDPTAMTMAQIQREVQALEKLFTQRLSATDEAIKVAHENLVRVPTEVDKAIGHLNEVMLERFGTVNEKFASVATQFAERDIRTEQTSRDSKVAVDAALQAAKEAVGKQQEASDRANTKAELSFTKQFDQISAVIIAAKSNSDDKIGDLKDRVQGLESEKRGQAAATTTQQTSNTGLVGIIGLVLGTLIGIGGLVVAFWSVMQRDAKAPSIVYSQTAPATAPATAPPR